MLAIFLKVLTKASKTNSFLQHFTAKTDNLLFIFKRKTMFGKRKIRHGVHVHALHCGMLTQVTDSGGGLVGPGARCDVIDR